MTGTWKEERYSRIKTEQCFVLMPFVEKWSDRIWSRTIKSIVEYFGMSCIRADDLYGNDIMEDVAKGIRESRVIIADISGRNPNVFYELGAAHALRKDVIILAQTESDIPFDIRGYRCILYEDNADGYDVLKTEIPRFLRECLYADLRDNFDEIVSNEEKVVLYVSYGGTCRCAMANAITRDLLRKRPCQKKIRPISAGLISKSADYATTEAHTVVADRLGASLEHHKTIKAEFPLLKRADIILAMEQRMLDAVPEKFSSKAQLFTEFFGEAGEILDPYHQGYSAYSESFQRISSVIGRNMDKLCQWADAMPT